jgi:Arc/MetJ family transcription regulator
VDPRPSQISSGLRDIRRVTHIYGILNMAAHMKTTVELSDRLVAEAKRTAAREGTTLRQLIEEGLRRVLGDRKQRKGFTLRKASFRGDGLAADAEGRGWERIRDQIYEGRGA